MRILYVHPSNINYPGGAERYIIEVAKRLTEKGHEVGLAYIDWSLHNTSAADNLNELKEYGVKIYKCKYLKLPRGFPMINPSCLTKLASNYDIIYMSAYSPNEIIVYLARKIRKLRRPVVAVLHTSLQPFYSISHKIYFPIYIYMYRIFNKIHVFNRFLYNIFIYYYRMNKSKVTIIPNGVDTSFYNILPKYLRSDGPFIVLYAARFTLNKGIDILYKIIRLFNKKYKSIKKDVIFKIAGVGPYANYIEKLANKYDNVIYLGYLNKYELLREYNSANLFLVTSRWENMPLALLEASACGLPSVAPAIPGIIDVISTIRYGTLILNHNIEAYIKSIIYFYNIWKNNKNRYINMRLNIRKYTVQNYDWNIIINKIEKMLEDTLELFNKDSARNNDA